MGVRARIAKLEAIRPPELLERIRAAEVLIAAYIPQQIEWLLSWGPPDARANAEVQMLSRHLAR